MNILNEINIQNFKDNGVEIFAHPGSKSIGDRVFFEPPCSIKWIDIFGDFSIGAFSYAVSGYFTEVKIGRYCSFGENVQIGRGDHPINFTSTSPFFYENQKIFNLGKNFTDSDKYHQYKPTMPPDGMLLGKPKFTDIGNDVWIGHGAYIRPGIKIEDGVVIGAHSVVTKNIPAYSVVAGNPAKIVKMRFDDSIIERLLLKKWWRFAPWQLKEFKYHKVNDMLDQLDDKESSMNSFAPMFLSVKDGVLLEHSPEFISNLMVFKSSFSFIE